MNTSIFIATCIGCGAKILIWDAAPSSLCHRCEQEQLQQNEREQNRLDKWVGRLS